MHHGGTWAFIGGAIERGESAVDAALREAVEEEGLDPRRVSPLETIAGLTHPEWTYTYVLAEGDREDTRLLGRSWDWESDGTAWVAIDEVHALPLHPVLRDDWPWLAEALIA